jgi:hypothetical protein
MLISCPILITVASYGEIVVFHKKINWSDFRKELQDLYLTKILILYLKHFLLNLNGCYFLIGLSIKKQYFCLKFSMVFPLSIYVIYLRLPLIFINVLYDLHHSFSFTRQGLILNYLGNHLFTLVQLFGIVSLTVLKMPAH